MLEGAGGVVDAGVDDAAVVGAGLQAEAAVAFDDGDLAAAGRELLRDREADDASPNHGNIRIHTGRVSALGEGL